MPTLRAILDAIETGVNHHATSDDSRYQPGLAKYWLDKLTAQYLYARYTQEEGRVRRAFYQSDLYEEVVLPIQNGEATVPEQPFKLPFDDGIYKVFIVDSNGVELEATRIRPREAAFQANQPFKKVCWYRRKNTLRFVNAGLLKQVRALIVGSNTAGGKHLDKEYPIPPEMEGEVVGKVIEILSGQIALPADTVNDERDNAKL
jgi:hypothetical protein